MSYTLETDQGEVICAETVNIRTSRGCKSPVDLQKAAPVHLILTYHLFSSWFDKQVVLVCFVT